MKKHLFLLLIFSVLASAAGAGEAPNFKLKNLKQKEIELYAVLKEGPVLLDFWATWCKPCLKAFPKLNDFHRRYGERGLTILAINEDGNRNHAKVKPFVKSLNIQFEVLIDGNNDVMRKYGVTGLPATVLIARDGRILSSAFGFSGDKFRKLEEEIEKLLLQTKSAPEKTPRDGNADK